MALGREDYRVGLCFVALALAWASGGSCLGTYTLTH